MKYPANVRRVVLHITQFWCPCCDKVFKADELVNTDTIINAAMTDGVLVTLTCPGCNRIVQVFGAGESAANVGPAFAK